MNSWLESLRVYREPRIATMLFLGFAAGLPLPLTAFTLRQWMSESNVSLGDIGLTALIGIAYSFKFVWSPLMDRVELPWFTSRLGRRRGWLLPVQILLVLSIAGMGLTNPSVFPLATVAVAVLVAFLSASQDIVIDAYRIESLRPDEQGAGLAAYIWGYRIALLAANAGALFIVGFVGWHFAYIAMAVLMIIGIVTCLLIREPPAGAIEAPRSSGGLARAVEWLTIAVVRPFTEFMQRDAWLAILAFVALFKLGEALAGVMVPSFYRSLGYSRETVAGISGVFGLFATLGGVAVGGLIVRQFGAYQALIGTGLLQMLSNLMYVVLAYSGGDIPTLWLQVGVENFTDGLADAAFVAYLSSLTNVAFTATQYALLSSLASVPLRTLGATGGHLAEHLGWPAFFTLTTVAALPAMFIAIWLMRKFPLRMPIARPALAVDD